MTTIREKRCCCGKYQLSETLIVNNTMHEILGSQGAFCGPVVNHQLRDAEAEVARLEARVRELEEGIIAVYDLINASEGVYGLHLNGDLSPWNELRKGGYFESWLSSFDEAIESLRDGKRVIGGE